MIVQASDVPAAEREIVLTRTYDAPRELVWDALTQAEHLTEWWGPDGFTITIAEIDVRPGGVWRFLMHGPDGTDYPNVVEYREVVRPELLTYTHGDGENRARDFEVTVRLTEEAGRTTVTSRMVFATAEARRITIDFGAVELGNQTYAKLAEYLRTQ